MGEGGLGSSLWPSRLQFFYFGLSAADLFFPATLDFCFLVYTDFDYITITLYPVDLLAYSILLFPPQLPIYATFTFGFTNPLLFCFLGFYSTMAKIPIGYASIWLEGSRETCLRGGEGGGALHAEHGSQGLGTILDQGNKLISKIPRKETSQQSAAFFVVV